MPYTISKKDCKQSDGDAGSYVLSYTDSKGKKRNNCHTSKKKAEAQRAAIEGGKAMDETDDMVFGGGGLGDEEVGAEDEGLEEALLREWIRERLVIREAQKITLVREWVRLMLEAGEAAERQERGLIDAINSLASPEKPIEVRNKGETLVGVVGASKKEGMNALGKEPYTDVLIHLADGTTLNISAKGDAAPSLAGGGLTALNKILPTIVKDFLTLGVEELVSQGHQDGDTGVPDVYGRITGDNALAILRGNEEMGGPIDYMYQGPMDVTASACDVDGQCYVEVSGAFTGIDEYAQTHALHLRARKRRNDQPFAPSATDRAGLPAVFGKSPSKGDSNRRIVITDKVPGNAIVVEI